jgi:thioredoxin reductase
MNDEPYDVAIIGGGPAGLEATLVLARTRKRIIVFDDPQPARNSASRAVHNLLGLDGLPPAAIRDTAWTQIAHFHSAELRHEQVRDIRKEDDERFRVTGNSGSSISAWHVVLAFGYQDVHPTLPGFSECWANTIIPCPYCDGYENRDRVWGVVASTERDAHHFPKLVRNWTADVKLLLQPGVLIDAGYEARLIAAGTSVHRGGIRQIQHTHGKVEAVVLETGEKLSVGTLLWIPPKAPVPLIHMLVGNLGLAVDADGYVKTNDAQQTNIEGLWAAGDVQNGRWALDAIYTGGKVAQAIIRNWYS